MTKASVLVGRLALASWMILACQVFGQSFDIATPAGPITIQVSHVGPAGGLVAPLAPQPLTLRPPSIFSAPLPSGSGARALGMAGAFTALADDATAASWNPAGLVQLESPEASVVYRFSRQEADHRSTDDDFRVGSNSMDSDGLNYFSLAYPFFIKPIGRNAVVSLNRQEAYDFSQRFTADLSNRSQGTTGGSKSQTYKDTEIDTVKDDVTDIIVTSHLTTEAVSSFKQIQNSSLLSTLDFEQEGVITALTPAFAMEITPKFSVGAALNWHELDALAGDAIRSRTTARYSGKSSSASQVQTVRTTTGNYDYSGTVTLPPSGDFPFSTVIPVGGTDLPIEPFSEKTASNPGATLLQEGLYEEENEYTDLEGFNATLGTLWTINSLLTLGASVDLPWTAEARQTKTVRNTVTTYDAHHTRVLDVTQTANTESGNVEMDFPLFWNAGAVFRWTPSFYTTHDLGQTLWSDFAFQAEDGEKINPLSGELQSQSPLADTWSYRAGAEYLIQREKTEIPLRCGFAREERPALDRPDLFYTASLGTGIAFGKDPGRTIFDIAYSYTWAEEVRGIVPSQPGLTSDIDEHQVYVSVIQHF